MKDYKSKKTVKKVIFENIDVQTKVWGIPTDLLEYNTISIHFIFSGLTGTTDGTVTVKQSSDPSLVYLDIPTLTGNLDAASGVLMLESSEFLAGNIALSVNKGGITGGKMTAVLIAKKK